MILVLLAAGASAAPLRMTLTAAAAPKDEKDPFGCWEGDKWMNSNAVVSCKKGGTRMCDMGSWILKSGDCTGELTPPQKNAPPKPTAATTNPVASTNTKPCFLPGWC